MVVSSILLIVSFFTIFCTVITEEITNQDSAIITEEHNNNFCKNPKDIPLFGTSSCISPALYTALFLTSIILAGITFLMLISFLLLLCIRRIILYYSNYYNSDEASIPDIINSDSNKHKAVTSTTKPDKEISNVLRKIVTNSPVGGLSQTHIHHSFPIPTSQESILLSSSNSYTDSHFIGRQSHPMNIISTISESYELTTLESTKRSSINRKDSINSSEYNRKYSIKF